MKSETGSQTPSPAENQKNITDFVQSSSEDAILTNMEKPKRGGKREGSGRKAAEDPRNPVSLRMTASEEKKVRSYLAELKAAK